MIRNWCCSFVMFSYETVFWLPSFCLVLWRWGWPVNDWNVSSCLLYTCETAYYNTFVFKSSTNVSRRHTKSNLFTYEIKSASFIFDLNPRMLYDRKETDFTFAAVRGPRPLAYFPEFLFLSPFCFGVTALCGHSSTVGDTGCSGLCG